MKKILFLWLLWGLGQPVFAQKFALTGMVTDHQQNILPGATVLLLQPKDSALVAFTATNNHGIFNLKANPKQEYLLKVTFVGLQPAFQKIAPLDVPADRDLGNLVLKPVPASLQEVLVKGEKSPVEIKKDTIEYNAGSFKTQPNAVVEDLLKRLPGVDVESDGSVSVQGQKVKRVTVDGKEFFGQDPKIATKNLPADAIDKVQVFDKKSDQAMFTGIDDGQREKTINLKLKEEKRNGAFGNLMGGVGTDSRWQGKTNLNRFGKGKQLSVLGMANNVNEQGFGIEEYLNFSGGMRQMASGGAVRLEVNSDQGIPLSRGGRMNGLLSAYSGGVNFNNQFTKKSEGNGSYFFNHLSQFIDRQVVRETPLAMGIVRSNQDNRQQNTNSGHRANFSLDQKLDSVNSLKLTGSLAYNQTSLEEAGTSQTFSGGNILQNQNQRRANVAGNHLNLNSGLLFRHRFAKKGRTFTANTLAAANQNSSDGRVNATTAFANKPSQIIDQEITQDNEYRSLAETLTYTEPLGRRKYLEANYTFRMNYNRVNRAVYDQEGDARHFNQNLSNKYHSNYMYNRAGTNFRLNRSSYNFLLGTSVQQSTLQGTLELMATDIRKTFTNLLPTARLNYTFPGNKNLEVNYETSVQEPGIRQLQPFTDVSDPLNIYEGNPELRPAYQQEGRINFHLFDPARFVSFFAMVQGMYTTNAISNAQTFGAGLVRTIRPVNVKDSRMLNANVHLGFPIRKLNSRFNLGSSYRQQQSINVLNDVASNVNNNNLNGNIRYEYRLKELFDFSLRANVGLQNTQVEANQDFNQRFYNNTYTAATNINFLKKFNLNSSFDYQVYHNPQQDLRQTIPFWQLSVSRYMLKNNGGELKLSALNLLDRNLGINQTANVNYIEQETLNSLGRYFMLSFTYALNKHLNPMGNRRGGMIRIER